MAADLPTMFDRWVVQGGPMMIAIVPCAMLAVAFAVQGALNLRRHRIAPKDFHDRFAQALASGGQEGARAFLDEEDHSLADVLRKVDVALHARPDAHPDVVLQEKIEEEIDLLLQQNSQLAMIYRVGPQLGLLGTVFGMISTFSRYSQSANPDVQQLSVGIGVALITTAWGLSIAIPAYFAFYLLQRRIAMYEQIILPREAGRALHLFLGRTAPPRLAAEA